MKELIFVLATSDRFFQLAGHCLATRCFPDVGFPDFSDPPLAESHYLCSGFFIGISEYCQPPS